MNIFTAVLDEFSQNFTEIPQNSDFWLKLPAILPENKVMLLFLSEILNEFPQIFQITI